MSMANNGWISVKDRLPNIDEEVLVLARGMGILKGQSRCAVAYIVDRVYYTAVPAKTEPRWRCPIQFFLTDFQITHWMPLPEPPKEDDDETD